MAAVLGDDGRILRANADLCRTLEQTEAELQAKTLGDIVGSTAREVMGWLESLRGPGTRLTLTLRTSKGQPSGQRWLRLQLSRSSDGAHLFLLATDLTAWKKQDEAREERAGRLRAIIRHLPVAFIEFGVNGKVLSWNPAAERTFGYSAAEMLGRSHVETISMPRDPDASEERARELGEAGYSHTIATNRTKDGRMIRCEWSLVLIRDEAGNVTSIAGLVRDITEKEKLEQELLQSRQLLQTVLDNVPIILWSTDPSGNYNFIDGAGLKALGRTREELLGQNVFTVFKDVPGLMESRGRSMAGFTTPLILEIGDVVLENRYALQAEEDGRVSHVVGVTLDVTERARTEQELRHRLEVIEKQKSEMRAMAIPILQVWDDVLAVPIIGAIDGERAADLMDSLLRAVSVVRATHVIIDLTGVEAVDTSTADHLLKVVQALELLGARAVVSGIKPSVAHIVVSLGAPMSGVTTVRNLREALRWCMGEMEA